MTWRADGRAHPRPDLLRKHCAGQDLEGKMMRRLFLIFAAMFFALAPARASEARDLKLEEFFKGRTYAYGWFGAVNGSTRRFRVVLDGRMSGKTLILREAFEYEDGEKDVKTWRFRKTGPTTYLGTREDVIGETLVTLDGPNATFAYDVDLTPKAQPTIVRFYDTLSFRQTAPCSTPPGSGAGGCLLRG